MTNSHEDLYIIGAITVVAFAAWGWFSDKSKKIKEGQFNHDLRATLEAEVRDAKQIADKRTALLDKREKYITELRNSFDKGYICGRQWLAHFIAEADRAFDEATSGTLRTKRPRAAPKAADELASAYAERRKYKEQCKFLEYQLLSYKEYFPFLDEYEELILDEAVAFGAGAANIQLLEGADPVLRFVPKAEFDKLSTVQRNQLALDRYLSGNLSRLAIGRLYERYIGYLYESDGWAVEYHGIVKGQEDLGRDLICTRGNDVHIVQVKCWSKDKIIHEKHVFQLFGTTQLYQMSRGRTELFLPSVTARFITSTVLSPIARQAAEWLKIEVEEACMLDKTFPMIKCNINQTTREKIYHLPFDQQYDRTKITLELGEFYAATVADAERLGFRRAFRYLHSCNSA